MFKFSRLSLWIFTLAVSTGTVMAQAPQTTDYGPRKSLPTSPEAAMLGKFGDIPIGYYTGTADVSVPMYTIKEAGVEIPIVLRYHGSGIKVEDEASNVGLGWSLDPGGAIIKVIQGKEDFDFGDNLVNWDPAGYTYLKSFNPVGVFSDRRSIQLWGCIPQLDSYATFAGLQQGEGQPDIFQYNFPGHSGKFFINPDTRKIVLLDKTEDIDFEVTGTVLKAVTMDGNTFEFSASETTVNAFSSASPSSRTYKLSKIRLYNGKVIDFNYQDGYYESLSYGENYHTEYPFWNDGPLRIDQTFDLVQHKVKMLSSITTDENTIVFNLEDRIDLKTQNPDGVSGAKRIASVDIKDALGTKKLKSFVFGYDYFTATDNGQGYLSRGSWNQNGFALSQVKRLKLLSVTEAGYDLSGTQVLNKPYLFNYEENVNLPVKSSFGRDFWGYYNGKEVSNNKLIPDLSFFANSNDIDYGQLPSNSIGVVSGANRSPDSVKMKAAMLKKITYPTGGSTEFEYQAHDFSNHNYPDLNNTGSFSYIDVADHNRPNENLDAVFSINSSQTITFHAEITRGPNQSVTSGAMQAANVVLKKILNGVTTVIQTWQFTTAADYNEFDDNGTVNFNQPIFLSYEPGAQYMVSVSMPDELGEQSVFPNYGHVSCSFTYQPLAPLKNSFGGGLRVSGIRNYTSDGVVASIKKIAYKGADNLSSGLLMTPIKPLVKNKITALNRITDTNNGQLGLVQFKVMDVFFISSESAVPVSSGAGGGPVGYTQVDEMDLAPNGTAKGKKTFIYNNAVSNYAPNVPEQSDPYNGKIYIEKVFAANAQNPLIETTYLYDAKQPAYFNGVTISNAFVGPDPCSFGTPWGIEPEVEKWMVHFYPLNSYWIAPLSKETKQYFDGNVVATKENYLYNAKGQLVQLSSPNSKQQQQVSSYVYPVDNPSNPSSALLIAKNRYNSLQKQTVSVNNVQTEQIDFNYKLEDNQLVQGEVKKTVGANPPSTEVTFDKYLDYQTPYQFTQKSAPSCFLWSFNYKKPIAEIKNIDHITLESIISLASIKAFAANPNPSQADINAFLAPLRTASIAGQFQIHSFTYDESTGLGSQTDAKGMTTYYNYDAFQRLKAIKDQNNNILKQTEYHYKN